MEFSAPRPIELQHKKVRSFSIKQPSQTRRQIHQQPGSTPNPRTLISTTYRAIYGVENPETRAAEQTRSLQEAEERMVDLIANQHQQRTIQKRVNIWSRLSNWCRTNNLEMNESTALLFFTALKVKPQTAAGYISDLRAVIESAGIGWDCHELLQLQQLLSKNAEDPEQAEPADRDTIYSRAPALLAPGNRKNMRTFAATLLLMWKGRLRHADAMLLRHEDIILTEDVIILDLERSKPRTRTQKKTNSDTRFALIAGEMTQSLRAWLEEPAQKAQSAPFATLPESTFVKLLKEQMNSEWTLHSPRVGALDHLLLLTARGVSLAPTDLRIAARHKAKEPILPPVTLGYLRKCRVSLAAYLCNKHVAMML